jgi:uncharacterized membrane protein YfcA
MIALGAGVLAGMLTTVAGMGGGIALLVLLVAWTGDPAASLAASALGLFVGNVHRTWLFRRELRRDVAVPLIVGGTPAAAIAGRLVAGVPDDWLTGGIAVVSLLGVAFAAFGKTLRPPRFGIGAAGATIGATTAVAGGGALLTGPFLLSLGLTGEAYVATASAFSAAVHIGRITGYGLGGVVTADVVVTGLCLAAGIPVGNLLGKRVRARMPTGQERRLELSVAAVVAGLALAGLA